MWLLRTMQKYIFDHNFFVVLIFPDKCLNFCKGQYFDYDILDRLCRHTSPKYFSHSELDLCLVWRHFRNPELQSTNQQFVQPHLICLVSEALALLSFQLVVTRQRLSGTVVLLGGHVGTGTGGGCGF